jgi:hypothetical protein
MPLRDLMPAELTGQVEAEATDEVPDLDLSEEVFAESPPADPEAAPEAESSDAPAASDEAPEAPAPEEPSAEDEEHGGS